MFAAFAASFGGFLGLFAKLPQLLLRRCCVSRFSLFAIVHSFIGGDTKTLTKAHRS